MKKIIYLLLLLFIVSLTPNAYAYTYDVTNNITSPRGGASTGGRYLALEIYNTGSQNTYSVNTRYNGTLSNIEFNLPLPAAADECFTTNMEYTITMEMATSDWRNHFARPYVGADSSSTNWATSNVTFVSMKKIYFKFKIPAEESLCYGFVYVRLNSTDTSDTPFTGVSNWNLSKISLSDQYSSSGGGSSGGSSTPPTPTPNPNQNIIDNANENTNNIIENNNSNTDKIIDSINDTFNPCSKTDINISINDVNPSLTDKYLGANGTIGSSYGYNISYYLPIIANADYRLTATSSSVGSPYFCWYDGSFQPLHCTQYNSQTSWTFHTGSTAKYIRFTIPNTTGYQLHLLSNEVCINKLDETNNSINNVNESINNDNVDSGVGSDFFEDFEDEDFGLSSIITIPLNTIQGLTSKSCVALNVPIPFTNSTVPLPCMTQVYEQNIPTIYNIWKIVSFGIIAYFIAIDIFHMVKGFKDPESDKVEVLDL